MNNIPRLKAICISPQMILSVFRSGAIIELPDGQRFRCASDFPDDASFHHVYCDHRAGTIAIVMEHESFPPKTEASEVPYTELEFRADVPK